MQSQGYSIQAQVSDSKLTSLATKFQFLGNNFKNITISNLNIGKNFQIYVGMTWTEFEQDFFANIWNFFSKTWNPGIIFLTVREME